MQVKKEGDTARIILSPEQQQALKNFTAEQAGTKKELRVTRRNLRQDVDALESRLKWVNIAAMPVVVSLVGAGSCPGSPAPGRPQSEPRNQSSEKTSSAAALNPRPSHR